MSKEELSNWLISKILYCYPVVDKEWNDYVFYFYDEQYIRKLKLFKLYNIKITSPNQVNGICLFSLNIKYKIIYFHYEYVWKFFENNYINNYIQIEKFITEIINDYKQLNKYSPKKNSQGFRYPELIRSKKNLEIREADWSSLLPSSYKKLIVLK